MRKGKNYMFLLIILMVSNSVFSQSQQWASDSLAYYQNELESRLKKGEQDEAKQIVLRIEERGLESLDPKIFEYLYSSVGKPYLKQFPEIIGFMYRAIGMLEFYRGEIIASKAAFRNAKDNYIKSNNLKHAAGMAMNIGVMQEKMGYYDSAVINYKEALPIFESVNDINSLASVYENIGLAHYRKSENLLMLNYLNKTDSLLQTVLEENDPRWVGLYINKHLAFLRLNRQEEALDILLKGLKIAEVNQDNAGIRKIYSRLAELHESNGEKEKQYNALMISKSYLKESQNKFDIANMDQALGRYHLQEDHYDSAMYYAQKSYEMFLSNGLTEDVGTSLSLMGNIEFKKENYPKALQYYQKALESLRTEQTQSYAGFLFNIGYTYLKVGDFSQALGFMEKSLEIRKQINHHSGLRDSYQGLAEVYESRGDFRKAFDYLTLFHAFKDSISNEARGQLLAEIETRYETEKKDQAIAVLEQQNEIQSLRAQTQQIQIYLSLGGLVLLVGLTGLFFRQSSIRKRNNILLEAKNKEIAKQNAERELLLKEIHHRVKNNLQIISSLLSMQTRSLKDDKAKDAMKESQSRVKTMALIHEKLYQYENLAKINMKEYMQQLSDFLTQTYRSEKQIHVNIDAEDINLDMDMAIPLGLITNELLSNSLKYAFQDKEGGEIYITFTEPEPGIYKLLVRDSGKGLDDNLDIENTKSLGLKLVRTLTRQINGNLKISSNPGATFEIDFSEQSLAA
ncbi:tetratricopeptide repeat-containing sensor histidine kinase [Fontibacter flavus]|uniref:Histidine kinase dimerization/phosphoacceptor domain -containing protein n=1 Tax=Fontibacter flavus TaxID=654838 RepID=A0ABV6FR53_9BACT